MIAQPRTAGAAKSLPRLDADLAERQEAPEWVKAVFGVGEVDREDRATVRTIGVEGASVGFECEVVGPKSAVGRTVYVIIPPEQVLAVLKLCRRAAAHVRSEPLGGASKPS